MDTREIKATHILSKKYDTQRKFTNRCLKAMSDICGYTNGTLRNPYELASSSMRDGRTLIQTIHEDGYVMYNDGWYIVEAEYEEGGYSSLYVDVTGIATRECDSYDNMKYVVTEGLQPEDCEFEIEKDE